MKVIQKYTAIQIRTKTVDQSVNVSLYYGDIEGPYYSQSHPEEEFETEEEAMAYAYEKHKWGRWLIVPIIRFNA